ncbi:MAG: hypothetical protein H0V20_05955, partial [Actinobacteria bacterium]|nr:hypothetical protein [Actinomycetota bacterium]
MRCQQDAVDTFKGAARISNVLDEPFISLIDDFEVNIGEELELPAGRVGERPAP